MTKPDYKTNEENEEDVDKRCYKKLVRWMNEGMGELNTSPVLRMYRNAPEEIKVRLLRDVKGLSGIVKTASF